MLDEQNDVEYCMVGLTTEIQTANKELVDPTTRQDRPILERFQISDDVKQNVSIISKDKISEFDYDSKKQVIEFVKNSKGELLVFLHKGLIDEPTIILNGKEIEWQEKPLRNKEFTAISFSTNEAGQVTMMLNH